jgi:tRNA(Ile)-lysidine synthase
VAYLEQLGQAYRADSSNTDLRYTRNRIRHELLPQLNATYNRQIVDALCRLGQLAGDAQQVIEHLAIELADRCTVERGADRLVLDVSVLAGEHRHLVRETLVELWRRQNWPRQAMGCAEWDLLADMALSDAPRETAAGRQFPGGVFAIRESDRIRLARPR